MAMTGDFKELANLQHLLQDVASGKVADEARQEAGRAALELAKKGFRERRDPYGRPWIGSHGALTLRESGALEHSLRVEMVPQGMVLVADGPYLRRSHGHDITEAVVHQWGGTIVARHRGSRSRSWRKHLAYAEQEGRNTAAMMRFRGAQPMRFRVGGRWVSTYSFNVPSTPILPSPGRLPDDWARALEGRVALTLRRAVHRDWIGNVGRLQF